MGGWDDVRRIGQLSARQWCAVCLSLVYLPVVEVALRFRGLMPTLRWLRPPSSGQAPAPVNEDDLAQSLVLGRVVERVSACMPWRCACLPLSVTQWIVLGRLNVATDLRIGVNANQEGIAAHAWVQIGEAWLGSRVHEGVYDRIWSSRSDGLDFPPSQP